MVTGFRIKERRKQLGISADKLAETLGVNRSTIFRYEKGDIEKVPATTLARISTILHTSSHYLMGWTDDAAPAAAASAANISNQTIEKFSPLLEQLSSDDLDKVYELANLLLLSEKYRGTNGSPDK